MTPDELKKILEDHALWSANKGGSKANLDGAYLGGANLRGANLGGAYLGGAYLSGANLRGANLAAANLRRAYLSGTDLRGTDFRGANLGEANLGGADLGDETKAVGLIARATRVIDPYEFFAWQTDRGPRIKAGCNFLTPAEYRTHVAAKYPDTDKAAETLRILDFFDASFSAIKPEATP